jgi:[NiFe] hydrogenase assembly HybE family chaperone
VQRLEQAYQWILLNRMQGLPILEPRLQVQAIGFEEVEGDPAHAQGVLITPWFMSLVHLPLHMRKSTPDTAAAPQEWRFGHQAIPCLPTPTPGLGVIWLCSLYSPMHAFPEQQKAVEMAASVLDHLRQKTPQPPSPATSAGTALSATPPSRRSFFTGRR